MKQLKSKILKGTLILTVAGFLTRVLGFFYRIFLADQLGAALLGRYQLIFPLYSICFTIYGAGIQTAISQQIAASTASTDPHSGKAFSSRTGRILLYGILLSLTLSVTLQSLVQAFSPWIASTLLLEPTCAPYLKILSVLFPFCGVTACINGYYYGLQDAKIPAVTQIIEQAVRVGFVFLLCSILSPDPAVKCKLAVWGLVTGEICSNFYNIFQLSKQRHIHARLPQTHYSVNSLRHTKILRPLLTLSVTLTSTKLILAILHSVEAIFIPAALRKYGCSPAEALSIYGILSGMVLPFILFPSTITNSIAVMLLPAVAESQAEGNKKQIRHYVLASTRYCLLIGLFFTLIFLIFGKTFGMVFFHNKTAGTFMTILAWLCPFLYLSTTLSSIINGLGNTQQTFLITVVSQSIKIYSLVFLVPRFGIMVYLGGTLVSQIVMALLECIALRKYLFCHRE